MQARYYDPVIGRFYSSDPKDALSFILEGKIQGFNRYTYGFNNPYKYTDPDGKDPVGNMFAQMFGYKNVAHANAQSPKDIAAAGQAIKGAVREGAGNLSDAATIGAVATAAFGQVEVAGPLAAVATVSGAVEAALSDTPAKDLTVEAVSTVTGAKSVGTIAKIANGLSGNKAEGIVTAASEAAQDKISDVIKEGVDERN